MLTRLANCLFTATRLFTATCLLTAAPALAQWSVRHDDPRPRNPAYLFEVFSNEAWDASNFATPQDLQWFRDAKYGMFVHFGLSTYKNVELSWGVCQVRKSPDRGSGPYPASEWTTWPTHMHLPEFDARQLVRHAQDAGMKYIVVIAKHHDGFHMWDTRLSDFKITNTPFGRDFLKEVADACHAAGMKFGIYYSQRDWHHPDYDPTNFKGEKHQRYIQYQNQAIRELCTNYGKVDIFWFDAVYWGGMFTADMWDAETLTRTIRQLQPGILINNRTNLPGDFDTPEQRVGAFQNHRPWESCMTLCATWSYSETPARSPKQLVDVLISTVCGDGNLLMSWGPTWSGAFAPNQVAALTATGHWIKKNHTAIFNTRGGPWLPATWGGSAHRVNADNTTTVFLHLSRIPPNHKLSLDGLKHTVLSARIHGGPSIPFNQSASSLDITIPPESQDPLATVVELAVATPITDIIPRQKWKTIFESPDYGSLISDNANLTISSSSRWDKPANHRQLFTGQLTGDHFAFHTAEELNPHAIIDLGAQRSVRGILIQHRPGYPARRTATTISLSPDGKQWEQIWKQSEAATPADAPSDVWEIPVTSFVAGAQLPGKPARYIKIERNLTTPDALHLQAVQVFGREEP